MAERRLLNARDFRRANEIDVDLGDGLFVRAKKIDMTTLVFEGRIPMPVLLAVQRMVDMPGLSPADRVASLGKENSESLVTMLRQHVVDVVIQPRLSMANTPDPDVLPIEYLSLTQLMTIWSATAAVSVVSPAAAADFRPEQRPVDVVAPPAGESVQPVPEQLAREFEFVRGQ